MIILTAEQQRALALNGKEPVRVIDPATKAEYFLVPVEDYERINLLRLDDAGWHEGALLVANEVLARDGWDDPRMDVYDALDPRKAP